MIAAIYARKSSPQKDADAEAKSVARQIDNAKAFARGKGWTVLDEYVFSDDDVSGGEVKKLRSRQRLLDLILRGQPPFQALVIRDESRFSRRDGDESFGELKRIAKAGVQVWFYQDGQPFKFGDLHSNVIGLFKGEIAAEYRRQCGRLTNEALVRKFKDGYVTGGRVFGYDNVRVNGHTERRINEAEAVVIRTIFKLYASGWGYTRIAKHLNAEGVPTPKPAHGRPAGWYHRTIGLALERELYRGIVTYGRQQSKAADGTRIDAFRPREQWLIAERPDLQIVTPAQWNAAHTRKAAAREQFSSPDGNTPGRRRDSDSRYFLSGFARCATCGGAVGVVRGAYTCLRNHLRGSLNGCASTTRVKVTTVDDAVRDKLKHLLVPATIMLAVERAQKALASSSVSKDLKRHRAELAAVNQKLANLSKAIEAGGNLEVLVKRLQDRRSDSERLQATILTLETVDVSDLRGLSRKDLQKRLDHWHRLLSAVMEDSRAALRRLLDGPLVMTPDGRRRYRFNGQLALGQVIAGEGESPSNLPASSVRSIAWSLKFDGIAA